MTDPQRAPVAACGEILATAGTASPEPHISVLVVRLFAEVTGKFSGVTRRRAVCRPSCRVARRRGRPAAARHKCRARYAAFAALMPRSSRRAAARIDARFGHDEIHRHVVRLRMNRRQPRKLEARRRSRAAAANRMRACGRNSRRHSPADSPARRNRSSARSPHRARRARVPSGNRNVIDTRFHRRARPPRAELQRRCLVRSRPALRRARPASRKRRIAKRASNSPLNGQQKPIVIPARSAKPASMMRGDRRVHLRRRRRSEAPRAAQSTRALAACATLGLPSNVSFISVFRSMLARLLRFVLY